MIVSLCSAVSLGSGRQGTMKREVFTDLYRWLRGSELARRHFSCGSVQTSLQMRRQDDRQAV